MTRRVLIILCRAKYQPYDALRQRFWRQYLKQYDTDDSGTISRLELTSMLDSLGSTLSRQTINTFFTRFSKSAEEVLTMDEAIQCLETELCRPASEKKRITMDETGIDTSAPVTPNILGANENQLTLNLDKLDFSGPPGNIPGPDSDPSKKPAQPQPQSTEPMQQPLADAAVPTSFPRAQFDRQPSTGSSDTEDSPGSSSPTEQDTFERVINVKSCPLVPSFADELEGGGGHRHAYGHLRESGLGTCGSNCRW